MITGWRLGGLVLCLAAPAARASVLPRTASHWVWMRGSAWSGRVWTVQTVDGRRLPFTP